MEVAAQAAGGEGPGALLVFGGEADPGQQLARLALAAGFRVTVVCSRPALLERVTARGWHAVACDVTDREAVAGVFADCGASRPAVVAILGGSLQVNAGGNINVIEAALAAGAGRFILTTSIGCGDSAPAVDPLVRAIAGRALRAKGWAEQRLHQTALDWTIIRAGGLVRRPPTGTALLTASSMAAGHITLADLGEMLFLALDSPRTIRCTLAAVDRRQAGNIDGSPLLPAEL